MFINAVNDREILDIVKTFQKKTSTNCFVIDMVIHHVIEYIVQPVTNISNFSFQTDTFPSNMKTLKVIPIY